MRQRSIASWTRSARVAVGGSVDSQYLIGAASGRGHSIILKGEAGGVSTITPRSVLRRTRFLPRSGWRISPLSRWPSSRPLAYPNVSSRGALPVRPERHVPESIATMYRLLAAALARGLPCLTCGHQSRAYLVTQ